MHDVPTEDTADALRSALECDECEDGDGCTCEQDALDEREQDAIDREDARREAGEDW